MRSTVKPSGVAIGVPKIGMRAVPRARACPEIVVSVIEKPGFVTLIVRVETCPAVNPVTVTGNFMFDASALEEFKALKKLTFEALRELLSTTSIGVPKITVPALIPGTEYVKAAS